MPLFPPVTTATLPSSCPLISDRSIFSSVESLNVGSLEILLSKLHGSLMWRLCLRRHSQVFLGTDLHESATDGTGAGRRAGLLQERAALRNSVLPVSRIGAD